MDIEKEYEFYERQGSAALQTVLSQKAQEIREKQHLFSVLYAVDNLRDYVDQDYYLLLSSLGVGDPNHVYLICELRKEGITKEQQIELNQKAEYIFRSVRGELSLLAPVFSNKESKYQIFSLQKENLPLILNILLNPKLQAVLEKYTLGKKIDVKTGQNKKIKI